jgi:hypothetical protein
MTLTATFEKTNKSPMTIQNIVDQCLKEGYFTPTVEAALSHFCENANDVSFAECDALDELMLALLSRNVVVSHDKEFNKVIEELMLNQALLIRAVNVIRY